LETFYRLTWLFFCCSVLGWLAETAVAAVRERRYVDRSLLFGPVCVIYGASGVVIQLVLRDLAGNVAFLFLGSAVYATVAEWLAGHWLEKATGARWWDYSRYHFDLDGYVCLGASAVWGVLGVAEVKWGAPLLLRLWELIPPLAGHILLWCAIAVFLVDCLATLLTLSGLADRLPAVEEAGSRLGALTLRLGTWVFVHMERRIQRAHPKAAFRREKQARAETFAPGCGFYKLFWLFFIGALLGDLVETVFVRVTAGVWQSRSSLVWGPFSVVWGLAMALATLLLYRYKDRPDSFLFAAGTVLGGGYEYLCSVFTEAVFGTVFWDYSHLPFNLGGRINLLYCFFWGIAAVAWFRLCYPPLSRLIERIPRRAGKVLTWALAAFLICDMAVSVCALGRYDARAHGVPPGNGWEAYIDETYGDGRMERIYPAAVRTN